MNALLEPAQLEDVAMQINGDWESRELTERLLQAEGFRIASYNNVSPWNTDDVSTQPQGGRKEDLNIAANH